MRAFRLQVTDDLAYWTVLDDGYELVMPFDGFLSYLRLGRDRAEGTTKKYAENLAMYAGWLDISGRDLVAGARELHGFVLWLRTSVVERAGSGAGRARSPGRVNHVLTAVREFYKYAAHRGDVPSEVLGWLWEVGDQRFLPAALQREGSGLAYRAVPRHGLRAPRSQSPRAATVEEVGALLRAAEHWRDRLLISLMWFCGLRVGAVLGLRRSDVHLLDSSIVLGCREPGPHVHVVPRDNPNGAAAKRRSPLVVPASWPVVETHARYLDERRSVEAADECDFELVNLWHDPLGAPMRYATVHQLFEQLSRRAGLDRVVTPHMLRHGFGQSLGEAGEPLNVIQELLGHASLHSTMIYTAPSADRLRRAVDRLGAVPEVRS